MLKALLLYYDTENLLRYRRGHGMRGEAAEAAAALEKRFLPKLLGGRLCRRLPHRLSFTLELHEQDHELVQSRNCCFEESRNLHNHQMLAPPSILLHSTSLDHENGKIFKVYIFILSL